jgi:PhnB protein
MIKQEKQRREYSLAPWLSVRNSLKALDFYKKAFGARENYRLDAPDGVVARLSIHGAEFWIADESPDGGETPPQSSIRMILTVPDPATFFSYALSSGATEIYPVTEQHGWRIGRLADPFGHHWEVGIFLEEG